MEAPAIVLQIARSFNGAQKQCIHDLELRISTLKEIVEVVVKPPEVVVKPSGAGAPLPSQPSQLDAALPSQGADAALPSQGADAALPSQGADAALPSQVVYVSVC